MNPVAAKIISGVAVALIFALLANPLQAQDTGSRLSGTVVDGAGKAVSGAKVSVKNLAS